jgi:hypothetical protein
VDVVCTHGLLAQIMKKPFQEKVALKVCAIKIKDTIYLCSFKTSYCEKYTNRTMSNTKLYVSWKQGLKIHQYFLSGNSAVTHAVYK